ncbi:MAG: ATP-binding protein [Cyanobacteria bacterium P01_H01_bin.74]
MFRNTLSRLINYKELIIVVAIGLSTLFLIDSILIQGFLKDDYYQEKLTADRIHAKVQSSLESHVTALIALKVIYQNFIDINQYDFEQYGTSITASLPGFKRLMYIDKNFLVKQIYPSTPENKGFYNYAIAKEPKMMSVLTEAKNADQATQGKSISRLLNFSNTGKSFWAFIPIFRNQNKEFLGFAAGELSIESIWRSAGPASPHYQVQLIDPEGHQLFKGVNLGDKQSVSQFEFMLLGQHWLIQLRPLESNLQNHRVQRASLWLGGLLILLLLVLINYNSKRHKRELSILSQQFETIFEASPDGILLLDDKLNIQLANPVISQWVGQTAEALSERPFFSVFACNCPHLAKCQSLPHLLCTTGEFQQDLPDVLETRLLQNDTDRSIPVTYRLNTAKISSKRKGKTINQFICVLGDITASKELERVKENYVATLTHDLKTPLLAQKMVLNNIIESGLTKNFPLAQERLLQGATESVQDLLDMVNSTLLFYRLESSHIKLNKQVTGLKDLLKDILGDIQPLAEKRSMTIALDCPLESPDVLIDPIQMKRVFQNLLSNAIHHSYKKSVIQVRVSESPEQQAVNIAVINKGPGIPNDLQAKIFDKYYTLSRRFKQIGTGLGLYISKCIVQLHGGTITVESTLNKETTFVVILPANLTAISTGSKHGSKQSSGPESEKETQNIPT